jgi:hypothetical protein
VLRSSDFNDSSGMDSLQEPVIAIIPQKRSARNSDLAYLPYLALLCIRLLCSLNQNSFAPREV